jgi:hypothetical protein
LISNALMWDFARPGSGKHIADFHKHDECQLHRSYDTDGNATPQYRNTPLRIPAPKIFFCLHAIWSAEVILKADVGSINGLRNREHSPGDATTLPVLKIIDRKS